MSVEPSLFCFDLADPLCYLAAEHALRATGAGPLQWLPVGASRLPRTSRTESFRCQAEVEAFQEDVERRAGRLGLQPLRWPARFPFDGGPAMLAATYAKEIGRTVPFAQAAFRQAFAGGHALDEEDFVLVAAAACEMHPRAVLAAMRSASTAERLAGASELAVARGVSELPAVAIGEQTLCGEQALDWILGEATRYSAAAETADIEPAGRSDGQAPAAPFSLEVRTG